MITSDVYIADSLGE